MNKVWFEGRVINVNKVESIVTITIEVPNNKFSCVPNRKYLFHFNVPHINIARSLEISKIYSSTVFDIPLETNLAPFDIAYFLEVVDKDRVVLVHDPNSKAVEHL